MVEAFVRLESCFASGIRGRNSCHETVYSFGLSELTVAQAITDFFAETDVAVGHGQSVRVYSTETKAHQLVLVNANWVPASFMARAVSGQDRLPVPIEHPYGPTKDPGD